MQKKKNKICTCSRDKSTLTSHPGETYYCKDLEELEENCKYLLFGIVYVTLITLLFVLVASLAPKIVFTTIFSSLLECCDFQVYLLWVGSFVLGRTHCAKLYIILKKFVAKIERK